LGERTGFPEVWERPLHQKVSKVAVLPADHTEFEVPAGPIHSPADRIKGLWFWVRSEFVPMLVTEADTVQRLTGISVVQSAPPPSKLNSGESL
jgi:hypothetical protein